MSDVRAYIDKFELSRVNLGPLKDFLCKRCGQRDRFEIAAFGMAIVQTVQIKSDDVVFKKQDSQVSSFEDVEWELDSYCRCIACDSFGVIADYKVDGLDAGILDSK
jgi:hypothetical protein